MSRDELIEEIWRPIPVPGFEGLYEVSSLGAVRSLHRGPRKLSATVVMASGGIPYRRFGMCRDGREKTISVHRAVALAFHGPAPVGAHARHLNGNSLDNRASNIAWGSPGDNQLDAVRHGTHTHARKTHCPQGHPYAGDNLKASIGARNCRTCAIERQRAWRKKKRATA